LLRALLNALDLGNPAERAWHDEIIAVPVVSVGRYRGSPGTLAPLVARAARLKPALPLPDLVFVFDGLAVVHAKLEGAEIHVRIALGAPRRIYFLPVAVYIAGDWSGARAAEWPLGAKGLEAKSQKLPVAWAYQLTYLALERMRAQIRYHGPAWLTRNAGLIKQVEARAS